MLNQQNLTVPYPYQQFVQQPMTVNSPPFIPQGLSVPMHIQHLVPQIVVLLINTIVTNANTGKPLRVFLFNMTVQNNYANDTFVSMVNTAVDLISFGLYKGFFNAPEMGLADSCEKTVNIMTAQCLMQYAALKNIIPPEEMGVIYSFVQNMQQVVEEVRMMKNQGQQSMNHFQNQNSSLQRIPVGSGNLMPNSVNNTITGSSFFPQGSIISNGTNPGTVQNAASDSKYDYLRPQQAPQQTMNVIPNVQQTLVTVTPQVSQETWGPKTNNPHPPTVKLFDEGDLMDRNKHFQNTLASMIAPADSIVRRMSTFDNNIEELVREKKKMHTIHRDLNGEKLEQAIKDITLQKLSKEWVMDMSLDAVLMKARIDQMSAIGDNTDCEVFQRYGTIIKPFLSTPDVVESIRKKAILCNSYKKVANLLVDTVTTYKDNGGVLTTILDIDRMLTKHLNSFLNNNLSLDITIDSFMSDVEALPAYIKDKNGAVYCNSLMKEEVAFIKNYFSFCTPEQTVEILDCQAICKESDIDDEITSRVLINEMPVSVTVINILLNELNIDFSKQKHAVLLSSVSHQHLNTLLKCLFNKSNFNTEEDFNEVAKVYLITADEVLLEAFEGKLGTEPVFLLKKINRS